MLRWGSGGLGHLYLHLSVLDTPAFFALFLYGLYHPVLSIFHWTVSFHRVGSSACSLLWLKISTKPGTVASEGVAGP